MKTLLAVMIGLGVAVTGVAVGEDVINYSIYNAEELQSHAGPILYSAPSKNKIAYVAIAAETGNGEVWVKDINTGEDTLLVSSTTIDPWFGVAISPDENYVLYSVHDYSQAPNRAAVWRVNVSTKQTARLLVPGDFVDGMDGFVYQPCITSFVEGDTVSPKLVVQVVDFDGIRTEGIYVVDIDDSANPTRIEDVLSAKKVLGDDHTDGWWLFHQFVLSPLGDKLALSYGASTAIPNHNICVITDIDQVLAGTAEPVMSRNDPRWNEIQILPINLGVSWTRNGSLTFAQDAGSFDPETGAGGDFRAKLVLFDGNTPAEPKDVQQGTLSTGFTRSPDIGGTWFSFSEYDFDSFTGTLHAGSLKLDATLDLLDSVRQTDISLDDTSGMVIRLVQGTIVTGNDAKADNFSMSVYTPITFREEIALISGVEGISLVRRFEPAGLEFSIPLEITILYDPREIGTIPEGELQVFVPSLENGEAPTALDVLNRDPVGNRITVALPSFPVTSEAKAGNQFCSIVVGAFLDSDGDGIPDVDDAFPYDADYHLDVDGDSIADEWETFWFGPIAEPGEDPLVLCSPDGDPDGDGLSNLREFQGRGLGLSPLEPNELPVTNPMLLSLTALLIVVGAVRCGRLQQNKAE